MHFDRSQAQVLRQRLRERPTRLIVVSGPRQVGKTTLVRRVLSDCSATYVAADQTLTSIPAAADIALTQEVPGAGPTAEWLVAQWTTARGQALTRPDVGHVLAIDEIQKTPRWSDVVKGLWDADRASGLNLHVILLGSSPWLIQKGLADSLAGRFELIVMPHWSYVEMQEAFDLSLDEYVYFGGYPGSMSLIREERRWRDYLRDSLIYTSIDKDLLQMTRIDKPALLKSLFELGCAYSGQIISYTKLQGQLQDAGNTVTLAHYLELLTRAGLLAGLSKYAGQKHRQRASSPKLNVLNTALISALGDYTFAEAKNDRTYWGRLVESAVGAHLCNTSSNDCSVQYWREEPHEVDFVLAHGKRLVGIEVKSTKVSASLRGLSVFAEKYKGARTVAVGERGVPLVEMLSKPAAHWLG